jgi:homoserine kinase type II
MLRRAALRFWLSRAADWHFPRSGPMTHQKDPTPMRELLERHRTSVMELP